MSLDYATRLDVGVRKRNQGGINEDSVAVNVLADGHLDAERCVGVFVLADGAGGERAGEIASYIATVEVTRRLTGALWENWTVDSALEDEPSESAPAPTDEPLHERLMRHSLEYTDGDWILDRIETAVRSTHTRILQQVTNLNLESAYTTIVVGVQVGRKLYYAWVGDSRAYVVNCHPERPADEQLSQLTRDHSLVERLRQQGEIDDVEAHVHRKGSRITRALGGTTAEEPASSTVQVETGRVRLYGDDIVLFTSDGLIDAYADAPRLHDQYVGPDPPEDIEDQILEKAVTNDEIRDLVVQADSLESLANECLMLANRRGGKDNISVISFRNEGLPESPLEGLPDRSYDPSAQPPGNHETLIRDDDSNS
jgi:serine/threonine protein phosphatase PrpC